MTSLIGYVSFALVFLIFGFFIYQLIARIIKLKRFKMDVFNAVFLSRETPENKIEYLKTLDYSSVCNNCNKK